MTRRPNKLLSAAAGLTFVIFLMTASLLFSRPALHASELDNLQKEISGYDQKISKLKNNADSLEKEIALVEAEGDKIKTEIKESELRLKNLATEIKKTEIKINETQKEIKVQKETLADYLRLLRELDGVSLIETIFSSKSFSSLMNQMRYTETLQEKTNDTLEKFKDLQVLFEEKNTELAGKQEEEEIALRLFAEQKKELARQQKNKEVLLTETRGEESRYQELKKQAEERRVDVIESLIVTESYSGSSASGAFSLAKAREAAIKASAKTGIRVAFLMAVMEQESSFGRDNGTGYYKTDMKSNLWEQFERVCRDLGLDPEKTPVSNKPTTYAGWGGAMGPAQIMPYEWLRVRGETAALTGHGLANPFNTEDAMMALGILMRNLGAGSRDGEYEAAGRYFAGGYWQKYSWYAESVLRKAKKYE